MHGPDPFIQWCCRQKQRFRLWGLAYLTDEILWREKAAFSDAVGTSMMDRLKKYAENYYADEEYEVKREKSTHTAIRNGIFALPWDF